MTYYLVILYLINICGEPTDIGVKEFASYFECDKQQQVEMKKKDAKYPFKRAMCTTGKVGKSL